MAFAFANSRAIVMTLLIALSIKLHLDVEKINSRTIFPFNEWSCYFKSIGNGIESKSHLVRFLSQGLVPVKWMAIESLTDRVYSEQSDV